MMMFKNIAKIINIIISVLNVNAGYVTNENGICIKCSNKCLSCDFNNLDKCNKCFKGFGLIGNECKNCNDKKCNKCDDNMYICQECKKRYILIEGKCEKKEDSFDSL